MQKNRVSGWLVSSSFGESLSCQINSPKTPMWVCTTPFWLKMMGSIPSRNSVFELTDIFISVTAFLAVSGMKNSGGLRSRRGRVDKGGPGGGVGTLALGGAGGGDKCFCSTDDV